MDVINFLYLQTPHYDMCETCDIIHTKQFIEMIERDNEFLRKEIQLLREEVDLIRMRIPPCPCGFTELNYTSGD